jgi:hypothetical protein
MQFDARKKLTALILMNIAIEKKLKITCNSIIYLYPRERSTIKPSKKT